MAFLCASLGYVLCSVLFTNSLRARVVVMELPARKYILCCSTLPPHPWLCPVFGCFVHMLGPVFSS